MMTMLVVAMMMAVVVTAVVMLAVMAVMLTRGSRTCDNGSDGSLLRRGRRRGADRRDGMRGDVALAGNFRGSSRVGCTVCGHDNAGHDGDQEDDGFELVHVNSLCCR